MDKEIIIKPERQKSSPKDVFMHLLMIGMLYASVFSFSSLWFNYINFLFPDQLNYHNGAEDSILFATSLLVVVFPVYILLSWLLGKEMATDPEKRELRARKWLVYFTLFVSAIAIIVEIVQLVYNFLSGELTTPFFLKICVVLLVAVGVFGYYLWEVRRKEDTVTKIPQILGWVVSVAVLGSVVYGFFLIGSPAHQRALRLDNQRVNDLQNIQSQIINYWQQKEKLPEKIADLSNSINGFVPPIDPETNTSYEYAVKEPLVFELCAVFKTENNGNNVYNRSIPTTYPKSLDAYSQNWPHNIGHACFIRTIDPELYKLNKPIPVIMQPERFSPS